MPNTTNHSGQLQQPPYTQLSDERLVVMIRADKQDLYREIMQRYQQKLLRYVVTMTRDDQQAADIVQETFIRAYQNLRSFDVKKKFSSWIYRIAHNATMSHFRSFKDTLVLLEDFLPQTNPSAEELLISKQERQQLHACLVSLPVLYRSPVVLYYFEDKSYEEISDVLRIPTSTVGTRLARARSLLKKICQKQK